MMISLSETLSWYEQNAQVFESRTATVDMTRIYDLFLPYVVQGGNILDAGCGVGRDALAFAERGYQVTAIDGSLEMVKRTRLRTATIPCRYIRCFFLVLPGTISLMVSGAVLRFYT